MKLPQEHQNVMITYKADVRVNSYSDRTRKEVVTRRAFFSKSDGFYNKEDIWVETPNGFFHVPQFWGSFTYSDGTTSLLPKGFNHYPRVYPEQIIKWEYE